MNTIIPLIYCGILILINVKLSTALECYVCDRQEDNKGKCVTTIETCSQEHDACLTEVSWGSTPYWTQGAQKQYYISKRCANRDRCHKQRSNYMSYCTYLWYEDWRCTDCCRGDRCNYYIFSNSGRYEPSKLILYFSILFLIFKYI